MAAEPAFRIDAVGLPNPLLEQRESAYRVLLVASLQMRVRQPKENADEDLGHWLTNQLERIFNVALSSGAFDKAGVNAQLLDDLCTDLGLFDLKPYVKKDPEL